MKKILFFFITLNLALNSQIINSSPQSGCIPAVFSFTKANPQSSYSWDLGNGVTGIDTCCPTVTFNTPGVYTIKEGNDTYTVTVYNKPTLKFDSTTLRNGCLPFTFSLIDVSTYPPGITPIFYSWTFGDGSTKTGNPVTQTITDYEYEISVSMKVNTNNQGCDTSIYIPAYLKALKPPKAKINKNSSSACHTPVTVKYTNGSTFSQHNQVTYQWTENGAVISTAKDLGERVYTQEGTYVVVLTVKNQFGCESKDTSVFVVEKPKLTIATDDTMCGNESGSKYVNITNFDQDEPYNYNFTVLSSSQNGGPNMTVSSRIGNQFPFTLKDIFSEGYAVFSVTKVNKNDSRCSVSATDSIFLLYSFPDITIDLDTSCGYPSLDTTIASKFRPYIDSLYMDVEYKNKYGWLMSMYSLKSKLPSADTILATQIDYYNDIDSFYRKQYTLFAIAGNINSKYGCRFYTQTYKTNYFKFYNFIKTNKVKGCAPLTVKGEGLFSRNSFTDSIYDVVDSVFWYWGDGTVEKSDTFRYLFEHTYTTPGLYKTYAISYNKYGCIDTSNFIYIRVGDSIPPRFSKSDSIICPYENIIFIDTSYNEYKNIFFRTDDYRHIGCITDMGSTGSSFHDGGWNYVYMYGEYAGCEAIAKDSFFVNSPTFELDYNRSCKTQDSIHFYLTRMRNHNNDSFYWNFGDGTDTITTDTFVSHLFPVSGDYKIKVSRYSLDPNACAYIDSTIIKSRHVKAIFNQTIYCKSDAGYFPDSLFPYTLDPTASLEADYQCNYTYTWLIKDLDGNDYPPITYYSQVEVAIPKDTVNLSLIARDVNGCPDTTTKQIILVSNTIDFSVDKNFMCGELDSIKMVDLSTSPVGIGTRSWLITRNDDLYDTTLYNSTGNPEEVKFYYIIPNVVYDSILITFKMKDNLNCKEKAMNKTIYVSNIKSDIDGSRLICVNTNELYYDTIYRGENFTYNWYVDNVNVNQNNDTAVIKINSVGYHIIKLDKINNLTNCISTDTFKVYVKEKPKIRIDNTFDTTSVRCYPNNTRIYAFDSLNINFDASWSHNGRPFTTQDTSYFILEEGINTIMGVITTDYGCSDTFINYDTVLNLKGTINTSKERVCVGDTIRFYLTNMSDIDSIFWNLGNGSVNTKKETDFYYIYQDANFPGDTLKITAVIFGVGGQCPKGLEKSLIVKESKAGMEINEGDTVFCYQDVPIKNLSTKGDSFVWRASSGFFSLDSTIKSIHFPYPDTFDVTLYSYIQGMGCPDSASQTVILLPIPKLSVENDSVCLGEITNVVFEDTLPNTAIYLKPDIGNKNPHYTSPINLQLDSTTEITVISKTIEGCLDSVTANFIIWKPIELPTLDTIIEAGKPVTLPFKKEDGWIYSWTPPLIDPSCNECDNPEVRYYLAQEHILTAKNERGCFEIKSKYFIDIYPTIVVQVPTAFTPNGDGNNDILYARGFGIKKLLSFKIYNRFGQLLFLTHDENEGWDGYYKGELQNSEPYFYTFEAEAFIPGKIVTGEGSFMLLK